MPASGPTLGAVSEEPGGQRRGPMGGEEGETSGVGREECVLASRYGE